MFMAKFNIIASAVVTDDSVIPNDDLSPYVIHVEAVSELPNLEVCFSYFPSLFNLQLYEYI